MSVPPGTRFGPHEIISRIAAGGMGEVYRARDQRIGREVAIKILPAQFSQNKERLQRFEREARAVSILNHPNILTLFDVGIQNDSPYLVLELLTGETLRNRLTQGALPTRKAIDFAIQIAKGLSAAHGKGIIHRDLKPENVFLTIDGRVKILDFGLAKLTQADQPSADLAKLATVARDTEEGIVLGTVFYMSPEQIRGKELDHRSDIFSFGMILYEMLAGKHPFHGKSNVQVIRSILEVEPPSIAEIQPGVPPGLERIAFRCLEKNPENRFQSAGDLCFALESLSSVAAGSVADRARKSRSKSTPLLIAASAVLFLLLIFANWKKLTTPSSLEESEPFHRMRISRLTTSGKVADAAISPDGKYFAYAVQEGSTQSLFVRQVAATSSIELVHPDRIQFQGLTFSPDGDFIYYVVSPLDNPQGTLYQIPVLGGSSRRLREDVYSPVSISPDHQSIAFFGRSAVMLSGASGASARKLVEMTGANSFGASPVWSPDGRKIAVVMENPAGYKDRLIAIDVTGHEQTPIGSAEWFDIHRLSWLSNGLGLVIAAKAKDEASGYGNYQIWSVSYPEGRVNRITNDLNDYRGLSVSADSRKMISVRLEQTSNIWILPEKNVNPKQITTGSGSLDGLWGISWTADGRLIYTSMAGGDEDLWIMGSDGDDARQLTTDDWSEIAPSTCGKAALAVFMSRGSVGTHIWRIGLDGRDLQQMTNTASEGLPVCTPDGREVIYVSSGAGGWTLWKATLQTGKAVPLTDRPSLSPAVSRDGKWIAYAFPDEQNRKNIAIIPKDGGSPISTFPLSPTALVDIGLGLRWSPDGQSIAYVDTRNGVSNVWLQPLEGGPPKQVTNFKSSEIFSYDLSRTGELAVARGALSRDVVLIENFK